MADPNGWPDASKPGVPLNPEKHGWHWLAWDATWPEPAYWDGEWSQPDKSNLSVRTARYLGPCPTPQEVAAREQAAAVAMREACAAIVEAHAAAAKRCSEEGDVIYRIRAEFLANAYAITQAADDVRVTPTPTTNALAAALAQARREGMKDAAKVAAEYGHTDDGDVFRIVEMIVAAIRAKAQEIKP